MDRNEVEHVARVSGKEAAQETLLSLGIDTTKPIETQATSLICDGDAKSPRES